MFLCGDGSQFHFLFFVALCSPTESHTAERERKWIFRKLKMFVANRLVRRRMESSVTKDPFPPAAQVILNNIAHERGYKSPYWFTLAQCRRSLGAKLRPHETPTFITLAVQSVIPFASLPKDVQERIADQHPAYFAGGVGILSHRYKWNAVLAKRLVQQLNPEDAPRAFYVDVEFAQETLKITPAAKDVIDIRAQSSVWLYNGDQLKDPFKAAPAQGVALNALTGRRIGQPGHDILLAAGILRGYTSPYWVAEAQIPKLSAVLTTAGVASGVAVPTLTGTVVPLAAVTDDALREQLRLELFGAFHLWGKNLDGDVPLRLLELVQECRRSESTSTASSTSSLPSSPPSSSLVAEPRSPITRTASSNVKELEGIVKKCLERHPTWLLFGANGWEATRSEVLVRAMFRLCHVFEAATAVNSTSTVGFSNAIDKFAYVNLEEIALRYPEHEATIHAILGCTATAGVHVDGAADDSRRGTKTVPPPSPPQTPAATVPSFHLEVVTRRTYYNAAAFEMPHYIAPLTRPIAIVDGKLAGRKAESALRHHALLRQFSSPVWVTRRGAKLLGVTIDPKATGFSLPTNGEGVGSNGFYNIDDVTDRAALLNLYPVDARYLRPGSLRHMMLFNGSWKPVFGVKRKKLLTSYGRKTSLWVSTSEVIMGGLSIKPGARQPYNAMASSTTSRSKAAATSAKQEAQSEASNGQVEGEDEADDGATADDDEWGSKRLIFNSEETSDPVRVVGLTAYYARPQVTRGP